MLRDARVAIGRTQAVAAELAGVPRSTYATVETRGKGGVTLRTLNRCALGTGRSLHAYLSAASAADAPRDAVHLRHQELVLSVATAGGWKGVPETALDRDVRSSRAADVLLTRGTEWAITEVWNWFDDVGAALRDWDRRLGGLEAYAIAHMPPPDADSNADEVLPSIGGCWVVRATVRNRRLVAEHRHVFRARFPGSAVAWLAALEGEAAMPSEPALLWVSVDGSRLFPSRLGSAL